MSILAHTNHVVMHRPSRVAAMLRSALRVTRAVLAWPLRVHANRRLLNQMVGMSAYELADIGLTHADVRDTAALPFDSEVGQFLSARAAARRRNWSRHCL